MSERFNDVTCRLFSMSTLLLLNVNSLQMCRLIVSDIITAPCNQSRVTRIGKSILSPLTALLDTSEKWTAVADICRCLHNFNGVMQAILDNNRKTTQDIVSNGVLQVCAAFTNSSVYRLKRTWDRISKTVKLYFVLSEIFISGSNCPLCRRETLWTNCRTSPPVTAGTGT